MNNNTVIAKCKYCGCEFTTDARHPNASCCGSLECRRAAARKCSKSHYDRIKTLYASNSKTPDPYHQMLDRKKSERRKRLQNSQPTRSAPISPSAAGVPPRMRPVSSLLLLIMLEMLIGFICPASDPDENRRCLLHNLERAAQLHDSPLFRTEMRNFMEFIHAQFPHFRPSDQDTVPHACSTFPS